MANHRKVNGLRYKKTEEIANRQDFYKAHKNTDLDEVFEELFSESYYGKDVKYIMVILEIEVNEIRQYFSDVYTKEAFENIIDSDEYGEGELIYNSVLEKLAFKQKYEGYKLINTFIRVIYENPSTNKKQNPF